MGSEQKSNSFRAAVLRGERPALVVRDKKRRLDSSYDALDCAIVPRAETRSTNHRDQDRHRLTDETAVARYKGRRHSVGLVNLSAGGAMIRASFAPRLWDIVELELGEGPRIDSAVRWIRGDTIGLEFAHETRIDCNPKQRAALLLEVIQRSFPETEIHLEPVDAEVGEPAQEPEGEDLGNRGETRHPLVWKGQIHFAFDSNPVRLRNISTGGALLDVQVDYPVGAEVMLDLGDAGQLDSTVSWAQGDQIGVKFKKPFDLDCLTKARPDVTPHRWQRPSFLDSSEGEDQTPWHIKWGRSSITELRTELEGFLKR